MGYYSNIHTDFTVDKEKFGKAVQDLIDSQDDLYQYFEDCFVESDELMWDEPCGKWYSDADMAKFIAPFVDEPGNLTFIGESGDGDRWGYYLDGQGNVFELEITIVEKIGKKLN